MRGFSWQNACTAVSAVISLSLSLSQDGTPPPRNINIRLVFVACHDDDDEERKAAKLFCTIMIRFSKWFRDLVAEIAIIG